MHINVDVYGVLIENGGHTFPTWPDTSSEHNAGNIGRLNCGKKTFKHLTKIIKSKSCILLVH